MKENRKTKTGGDILEIMVRAGLRPSSDLQREEKTERRVPIISIHGEDVEWHELETAGNKKDKAA
jgi:hypothetical protein